MDKYLKVDSIESEVRNFTKELFKRKGFTYVRDTKKVSRNEPCVCGSNLKYKKCCGK